MNKPHDNCHTNILSAKLPLRIHWQLSATLHPASTSAGCGRRGVLHRDATKEHVFFIGRRVAVTVGDGTRVKGFAVCLYEAHGKA